jgi:ADP-ribose pyrophosphatase
VTELDEWVLLAEETVYRSWAQVVRRRYRLPDGAEHDWDVLIAPEVVSIVAVTADHEFLLVRQFRPGPGGLLLELPGGVVERGEDVAAAAARELLEETGYAGAMQFVGASFQGANSTMVKHIFTATGCTRVAEVSPDPGEFLEVLAVSLEEFRDHLRGGALTDQGSGYRGLDALGLL